MLNRHLWCASGFWRWMCGVHCWCVRLLRETSRTKSSG
jgi:hypothetical protein